MRRAPILLVLLAASCGRTTPAVPDPATFVDSDTDPDTDPDTDTDTDTDTQPTAEDTGLQSFTVTGMVTDAYGAPVAEAFVLVGGREETLVLTETDGSFALWYEEIPLGEPAIVATKEGYRTAGYEHFDEGEFVSISMMEVEPPDNIEYVYEHPGNGFNDMKEDCSHCHTSYVIDFLTSKHASAAQNPLLHDLYAGVSQAHEDEAACTEAGGIWTRGLEPGTEGNTIEKCYLGGGVLPDLNPFCGGIDTLACDDPVVTKGGQPMDFGACADCHAPGIDGVAGGRNLHEATGLAYELGVHCDVCHKVRDVNMDLPPGVGNRLQMGRPSEKGSGFFQWQPVFYGPLIDVPNYLMGGSYQPVFDQSEFCAGCHEQKQQALVPGESLDPELWPDGLPVHSTYSEWQEGPYNQQTTQCQWCHMPGNVEKTNAVDITTVADQSVTFGFPREPDNNRKHLFRGPLQGSPRLIDEALYVSIAITSRGNEIEASISVANIGCGHAVPTGEPMRSVILLVEAEGACGTLSASGGMTLHDTGGAIAAGIEGTHIETTDHVMRWSEGSAVAETGQVVRVVRPSGVFDDYNGVGVFAGEKLSAADKGMEIDTPVGAAIVVSIDGQDLELDRALPMQEGDWVYLGDTWSSDEAEDGQGALHLAGHPGYSFSRVMLDSGGNRHVPHYKAVDMASDNRIPPGSNALTTHTFSVPDACPEGDVRATVLYRPIPLHLATERGWEADDYIIATATESFGP